MLNSSIYTLDPNHFRWIVIFVGHKREIIFTLRQHIEHTIAEGLAGRPCSIFEAARREVAIARPAGSMGQELRRRPQ